MPSLEREIRNELTDEAELHAVKVFAHNIRSLLMQPPLVGRRVLAIDPGFRTGCKLAALDETGNLLEDGVVFAHPPQNKKVEAKVRLEELIRKHQLQVVAIGNGTACRETEEVVSELIASFERRRKGEAEPEAVSVKKETPTAAPVTTAPVPAQEASAPAPAAPAPDTATLPQGTPPGEAPTVAQM